MGHIHAAAMAQYAEDALETDKPWERWEFCHMRGEYQSLHGHPEWVKDNKYRRKAKTILINGHEVPEPCRTPLKEGEEYWTISIVGGSTSSLWQGDVIDFGCLENGFIHLTRDAAEKHFEAIRSFTAQKEPSNENHF